MSTVYQESDGLLGSVSPRARWTVRSADFRNVTAVKDGSTSTTAVTTLNPYSGASITINLSKPCVFNMVVMDHGTATEHGYPRRVAVLTSLDGRSFERQFAGDGTRRATVLPLIKPVMAQYVRLQAVASGSRPWAIGELYIQ